MTITYDDTKYPSEITSPDGTVRSTDSVVFDSLELLGSLSEQLEAHNDPCRMISEAMDLFKTKRVTININEEQLNMSEATIENQQYVVDELSHIAVPLYGKTNEYVMGLLDCQNLDTLLREIFHDVKIIKERKLSGVKYTMVTFFLGKQYTIYAAQPELIDNIVVYNDAMRTLESTSLLDMFLQSTHYEQSHNTLVDWLSAKNQAERETKSFLFGYKLDSNLITF